MNYVQNDEVGEAAKESDEMGRHATQLNTKRKKFAEDKNTMLKMVLDAANKEDKRIEQKLNKRAKIEEKLEEKEKKKEKKKSIREKQLLEVKEKILNRKAKRRLDRKKTKAQERAMQEESIGKKKKKVSFA
ncbi:uncharacterized protein VTP21DRAFT_5115 [Calcarisporiella thermophila]|uniref:uncharacterized protein n=1 Tax=Calcarisporiella thermophila TaxID=911321 RepID=UPI003743F841